MATIAQTLVSEATQATLRLKSPRVPVPLPRRRRSGVIRAAATGPGPKPKADLVQNVRQGCDSFLQVIFSLDEQACVSRVLLN
jgi:hypothetical protein